MFLFVIIVVIALVYLSTEITHARIPMRKNKKLPVGNKPPLGKIVEDTEIAAMKKQLLAGNVNVTKSFAFALYATDMEYARMAAINIKRLRMFGNASVSDIVVVVTPSVPLITWQILRTAGASHILESSVQPATNVHATWTMSPVKLSIFGLVMWKIIVFIDSDGLVLSKMDHLFDTPLNATHTVAMAPAYWLPERRAFLPSSNLPTSSSSLSPPYYTSALIVCAPSTAMAEDVNRVYRVTHREDMFVINEALGNRVLPLSHLDVPLVCNTTHPILILPLLSLKVLPYNQI